MMKRKRPQGYVPGRNHLVDAALRELRKGLQPGEDPFFWDMNRDWSKVHGGDPVNTANSGTVDAAEGTLRPPSLPPADDADDIRRQPTLELDLPGKKPRGEAREHDGAGRGMRYVWAALVALVFLAAFGWAAFLRHPAGVSEVTIAHREEGLSPSAVAPTPSASPAETRSAPETKPPTTPIASPGARPQAVPPSTQASKRTRPVPPTASTARAPASASEETMRYNHGMD